MSRSRIFRVLFGALLLISGIAISLVLSAAMFWGELEARLYTQQTGDKSLPIQCPLVIAPWEGAVIQTVITNTLTGEDTRPQVNAIISHEGNMRLVTETLELAPLESRPLQWTVDHEDIVFERLILVNIFQYRYRDLPSRQGACSILVFSAFSLTGRNTFYLLVSTGVLGSLLGAALLYFLFNPFTDLTRSPAQLIGVILCLTLLGLFSALTRRWGLTLVLDAAALLAITTGGVETLFNRRK